MTGLPAGRLADLIDRVREIVGHEWEKPPVGRPHVLPLPTAVIAVLFGLRHNLPDEVLGEVFGCSQATITRYHEILQPILRWVTRPEVDQRLEQAHREGVLVDGFVAPVGERENYHGLFSGKKHVCGQNVQVIADLDGRVADVGEPVNGARHDAAAFHVSGIAERWADHLAPGGPGMIGDGGYQGTGPITPHKKPLAGNSPPGRTLPWAQVPIGTGSTRAATAAGRPAPSKPSPWPLPKVWASPTRSKRCGSPGPARSRERPPGRWRT